MYVFSRRASSVLNRVARSSSHCLSQPSLDRGYWISGRIRVLLIPIVTVGSIFETRKIRVGVRTRGRPRNVALDAQKILAKLDTKESELAPILTPLIQKFKARAQKINRKKESKRVSSDIFHHRLGIEIEREQDRFEKNHEPPQETIAHHLDANAQFSATLGLTTHCGIT
mmetsp:Transcript_28276/g.60821  ORF Transcript_28276/g.60821 Transcript_28276/m.60821 type:complete len:170 (-) Transcript_28276:44-553(-)